jgi:hypothetical protein
MRNLYAAAPRRTRFLVLAAVLIAVGILLDVLIGDPIGRNLVPTVVTALIIAWFFTRYPKTQATPRH